MINITVKLSFSGLEFYNLFTIFWPWKHLFYECYLNSQLPVGSIQYHLKEIHASATIQTQVFYYTQIRKTLTTI